MKYSPISKLKMDYITDKTRRRDEQFRHQMFRCMEEFGEIPAEQIIAMFDSPAKQPMLLNEGAIVTARL